MFAFSSVNYQSLLDRIRVGNCTLIDIVEDQGFLVALRNDAIDLENYLTQEHVLSLIMRYALSNELQGTIPDQHYRQLQRQSVNILTSNSPSLQNCLIKNTGYVQYFQNFPNTDGINSSLLCSNFTRCIDFMFSFNKGKFLIVDYDFVAKVLIEHIDILSFQTLFVKLCCDISNNFNISYDLIKNLMSSPKDLQKIYTLTKIVTDKPSLILFLNIPEILQPLYEMVLKTYGNDSLLCTQTCILLSKIIKATQPNAFTEKYEVEYGDKIDFTQPVNFSTAFALSVFPKYVDFFIDRMFSEEYTTQMNQSVYEALKLLDKQQLQDIATKHNIFQKIMNYYQTYVNRKVNGHFFLGYTTFHHQRNYVP